MMDLARKLDKADREALGQCAKHLSRMEQYGYAAEVYTKMGDMKSLINMRVEAKHWEDVSLACSVALKSSVNVCLTSAGKPSVL